METINLENLTIEQKLTEIKNIFDNNFSKGAYRNLVWKSDKGVRKAYLKDHPETTIVKVSKGIVRLGIDYTNTEYYKTKENKIVDGTRPIKDHWLEGYEHFILVRENDNGEKSYKLQVYASKTKHKIESDYYLNGEKTPKEDLDDIMLKESSIPNDEFIVFTIKLENLISIEA